VAQLSTLGIIERMKNFISIGIIGIVIIVVVFLSWRHFQQSPDEKLHSQIAGIWTSEGSTITFNSDGSFTAGGDTNHDAGTWRISGEMLTVTITNSTDPHSVGPVGKAGPTVQGRIIRVDSHHLTYTSGGQTNSLSR
jgi:hypothetical protein